MTELLRYRWTSHGPMLDEDGPFVTYSDHVEALRQRTRERLSGQVQMMDEIARCIADGHRGNGSAEDDVCCQVCEEIQCDPDCAIAVHVEALRQVTALATPETVMQATYWYEQGQRDALAAAVQRVEAIADDMNSGVDWNWDYDIDPTGMTRNPRVWIREAVAAIKGQQ